MSHIPLKMGLVTAFTLLVLALAFTPISVRAAHHMAGEKKEMGKSHMKTGKEMCNDKMPEMGNMHKGKKGGACGAHMNQKDKKAKKGMKGGKK
jgi:hypothetical protein